MYSIVQVKRTEQQWTQERGKVLFTWTILNPSGPTLNCVGIRDSGSEGQIEVFYRWMHLLGGEGYVLGFVDESSERFLEELREILKYAFTKDHRSAFNRFPLVTCVPSFVTMPEPPLEPADVLRLISGSAAFRDADWGSQIYYLQKFGSRFFDRAAEETRESLESIRKDSSQDDVGREYLEIMTHLWGHREGFASWKPDQYRSRPLSEGDTDTWWRTISDDDFIGSCVTQLAQAWVGAIHQSGFKHEDVREPFEVVREFLQAFDHPLWPEEWNTDWLLAQMGLDGDE
jgi:hypothetical protein